MNIKPLKKMMLAQLPLYLNGRLPRLRRRVVAGWLRRSPDGRERLAALRRLQDGFAAEQKSASVP
ncbi:MAG TPA: hypothetical protein VMN57_04340, partial [Anaerolineales bacterium]|nr:hypothetical protein [Anaerolineales bacterium]